jgi:hypothetical protein
MALRRRCRTSLSLIMSSLLAVASPVITGCQRGSSVSSSAPTSQAQSGAGASPPQALASGGSAQGTGAAPGPAPGGANADELEQLVSPIALYPDTLIAQILAASTYPTQVIEANRWLNQNANLQGDQLAAAVNQQMWDPSVKSLCQYPPVLKTMSDSLSWTSSLGQAYYNQPTDVLNAIQVMRKRAMDAGTLKSTSQQNVEVQSGPPASDTSGSASAVPAPAQTIIIVPAQPNTVYVPEYNPSTVYGAPVQQPVGYTGGQMLATGLISFGAGMLIGSLISNNDNDWGCNWHGGNVTYNRNVYVSNSNAVPGRWNGGYRPIYRGPVNAGGVRAPYQPGRYPRSEPYAGNRPAFSGNPSTRPYNPGNARQFASAGEPHFPSANRLSGGGTALNPPNQIGGGNAFNRPGGARSGFNKTDSNLRNDQFRGYGRNRGGGVNNGFGGYGPGRQTEAFSERGRQSVGGAGGVKREGGGAFRGGRSGQHGFGGGGGGRHRR